MPMLAEPAVPQAPQTLDARGLVAGEKETVADACDGGQVLVERILHVSQRPPVGKGEIDLSDGFAEDCRWGTAFPPVVQTSLNAHAMRREPDGRQPDNGLAVG